MTSEDWNREIELETFEDLLAVEGEVEDEEEEAREGDEAIQAEPKPEEMPATDEILLGEPSILDAVKKDPADPSLP